MQGPIEIVVAVAVVGYILARRMLGEPAQAKRLLLLPAVLVVVGFVSAAKQGQTAMALGFLIGTVVLSLLIGLLRGASVRVSAEDGIVAIRYTGTTLLLWASGLAMEIGAGFLLGTLDPAAGHSSPMLPLGAGLLAEGLTVLAKSTRVDGRLLWAKGRGDAPHRMSPQLDDLRQRMRTTSTGRAAGDPNGFEHTPGR